MVSKVLGTGVTIALKPLLMVWKGVCTPKGLTLTPELRSSSKMEPRRFCKSWISTGGVVLDSGGSVVVDTPPPPIPWSNSRSNGTEVGPVGS